MRLINQPIERTDKTPVWALYLVRADGVNPVTRYYADLHKAIKCAEELGTVVYPIALTRQ